MSDAELITGPAPFGDDVRGAAGNHVVLHHGEGLYSCLAHLRRDSVAVEVGQRVDRGEPVGTVGASGHAFGPHVHLHFMDGPDLVTSNPVPIGLAAEEDVFDPQAGQIITA
jgi:murein DD-endopeptidase MepM/ murein hydrolase activator NlpD